MMKWVPEEGGVRRLRDEVCRWEWEHDVGLNLRAKTVLIYTKGGVLYEGRMQWDGKLGRWAYVSRLQEVARGLTLEEAEERARAMREATERVRFLGVREDGAGEG